MKVQIIEHGRLDLSQHAQPLQIQQSPTSRMNNIEKKEVLQPTAIHQNNNNNKELRIKK